VVTSAEHLEDTSRAPLRVLPLHVVAKEVRTGPEFLFSRTFVEFFQFLQLKYTMHGFEWKDVCGVQGTGFARAIRPVLTGQLLELVCSMDYVILSQLQVLQGYNSEVSRSQVPNRL
jgi:hypothetical protein